MEVSVRVMCDADLFYLEQWLMDPIVLGWFPMSTLQEVKDALRVWQHYARRGTAYTAEYNGIPVGSANLYINTYEKLRYQSLFAIVVDKAHRGKGIGTKLLEHVIKEAKRLGVKTLHLEVYEGNPAQRLYERMGFLRYGMHKKFLKESDGSYGNKILMQKPL